MRLLQYFYKSQIILHTFFDDEILIKFSVFIVRILSLYITTIV
jgi:hypothetical protein